ncbi:MAG: putative SAM-dependent methyltransferase [Myxococcaceae bacterium]|nr:putative SAM-dependent methyltransferase [Myxococcaceae bacterium]
MHCDLRDTSAHVEQAGWDLIVCTGDTLTHLDSHDDVRDVLSSAARMLADKGRLVLTLRDYVSDVPVDSERWIVARSDASRILTCHLVYHLDHVTVTDIVHEWEKSALQVRASTYRKRRLALASIKEMLTTAGLAITYEDCEHGWIRVVASK